MDARWGEMEPPSRALYRRGVPVAAEELKQRWYGIQPVEGATLTEDHENMQLRHVRG